MNKLYSDLRSKIEKLQLSDPSTLKINFYKVFLGILKYAIILTTGAGNSFPLIFQAQGRQIVGQSYKDFKSYQKKVRIVFLLVIILALAALEVY
jgi:hypothetical protein